MVKEHPAGDLTAERRDEVDLPACPPSLDEARTFVRRVLTDWGFEDSERLQLTELITTELVSNVVRHVGGRCTLCISADRLKITLSVHDESPAAPVQRTPDETGGRGLLIVEALSTSWGFERYRDDGKRVWAQLD